MRKIFFVFSLWLGVVALAAGADNYTLTDGGSVAGDIIKADDNGVLLRLPDETSTNLAWGRFSQDALKQFSKNPKVTAFVVDLIEPSQAEHPPKAEINVNPVKRLERPANPSLIGGLFKSSVGLFILFVIYAANLFAAYEIARNKLRPPAQVMGLSAVLPIIGPIIFLWLPMQMEKPPEEQLADEVAAEVAAQKTPEEIQIAEASWKPQAEKKPESQVYSRGTFTFNKRFVETRFAAFVGPTQGEQAKKFTMELKTMKEQFTIERIMQVAPTEVILETVQRGQVTVPLSDIQEIKLNPIPA